MTSVCVWIMCTGKKCLLQSARWVQRGPRVIPAPTPAQIPALGIDNANPDCTHFTSTAIKIV